MPQNIYSQDKEDNLWHLSMGYGRNIYKAPTELKYFDSNALHANISRSLNKQWRLGLSMYQYSRHQGDIYTSKRLFVEIEDFYTNIDTEDDFDTQEESYLSLGIYAELMLYNTKNHHFYISAGPCISAYQTLGIWHQSQVDDEKTYSLTGFVSRKFIDFGFDASIRYEYRFENNFFVSPLLNINFLSEGGSFLILNIGHSF